MISPPPAKEPSYVISTGKDLVVIGICGRVLVASWRFGFSGASGNPQPFAASWEKCSLSRVTSMFHQKSERGKLRSAGVSIAKLADSLSRRGFSFWRRPRQQSAGRRAQRLRTNHSLEGSPMNLLRAWWLCLVAGFFVAALVPEDIQNVESESNLSRI